ncbi:hypothetical protein L596_027810 [Steinernema carpocapsae]|uniref:Calx-beta domain-containing protein n=1 Tax=Steinernema carpocapsae TaxID=34508 RepID=A0A4U5LWL9_STECR|nr:hypothetical protein L596_027810 [Steinernema carpocapsae]
MILDDDHAGVYTFEYDHFEVVESCGHLSLRVQRNSGARGKVIIPYKTRDGTASGDVHFEHKEGELVFDDNQTEAFIEIGVIDTEQYERCDNFFIELGEPQWVKKMSDLNRIQERFHRRMEKKRAASITNLADSDDAMSTGLQGSFGAHLAPPGAEGGLTDRIKNRLSALMGGSGGSASSVGTDSNKDGKENQLMLTEQQAEIAELGKPRLGQYKKCQITIKESKEFQSIVDRMLKTANTRLMLGTSSWREQFSEALTVSAGDGDDDGEEDAGSTDGSIDKEAAEPSCREYVMHVISVPWKLMFATIPPTDYWGGWACFIVSIIMIGVLTALIGDLASQFGCWVGLKDAVTAITFVALGTSVPDTFASMVAAVQDKYADSSIGNVTGSNGVNVFLGIGIAWTMAAIVHFFRGTKFIVNPGTLAFSVTIFCIEAVICITLIVLRRQSWLGGGELGGPVKFKVFTAGIMVSLWVFYIGMSSLESYCIIDGF